MPLDLDPIRARLTSVNQERWARNTEPAIDPRFPLGTFLANAPTDIFALLAEVESLRAELKAAQSSLDYVKEDRRQIQVTLDNLRYRIEKRDIYPRDTF